MNHDRAEQLLDRYFDEALTAAERLELERFLLSSPSARQLFWRRARFHALLRRRGRESWGERLAHDEIPEPAAPALEPVAFWQSLPALVFARWQTLGLGLVAAMLAIAVGALLLPRFSSRVASPSSVPGEAAADPQSTNYEQGIATLVRALDVQWAGEAHGPGLLKPGWLKLKSGLVELRFHRGARLILEGPIEFQLISDMQARCAFGKLTAEVPLPASGFEILSPNARIVDRGTAFGFSVGRDGLADVQVFNGKVEVALTRAPGTLREFHRGELVRVDTAGAFAAPAAVPLEFATADTFEQRAQSLMAANFAAWKGKLLELRNDPSLLVHYTFSDQTPSDLLVNQVSAPAPATNGTIIGCSWTEGRWPGKAALDFKQPGDRIRFALPQSSHQLTCIAWVRLDTLDHRYTALLMSGDGKVGELQWQLQGDGSLCFGKRKIPGWGIGHIENQATSPLPQLQHYGVWLQAAFVYDDTTRSLSHYLNGALVGQSSVSPGSPLTIASLEIGNWTPAQGQPMEPIRNFNGRMDEFLVFSRALLPAEIRELWQIGRPL